LRNYTTTCLEEVELWSLAPRERCSWEHSDEEVTGDVGRLIEKKITYCGASSFELIRYSYGGHILTICVSRSSLILPSHCHLNFPNCCFARNVFIENVCIFHFPSPSQISGPYLFAALNNNNSLQFSSVPHFNVLTQQLQDPNNNSIQFNSLF
jgi:hypothetical protein